MKENKKKKKEFKPCLSFYEMREAENSYKFVWASG